MNNVKDIEELEKSIKETVEEYKNDLEEILSADEAMNYFELTDMWWDNVFGTGRIDSMPSYPATEYERGNLMSICNLLELADRDARISEDSGLWEGMEGQQVLFAQAFHSAENLFHEYLNLEQ